MKTFSINTLGCKVNQYEGQQIRQLLEQAGLQQVGLAEKPDLAVVNTCCITHIASAKNRQYVRKIQNLNPNIPVVIAGCLPVAQNSELKNLHGNIHIVLNKNDLIAVLNSCLNAAAGTKCQSSKNNNIYSKLLPVKLKKK